MKNATFLWFFSAPFLIFIPHHHEKGWNAGGLPVVGGNMIIFNFCILKFELNSSGLTNTDLEEKSTFLSCPIFSRKGEGICRRLG